MDLTLESLSEILSGASIIPQDTLKSFKKRADCSTPFSRGKVEFLELELTPGCDPGLPTSLVVKTGNSKKEASFYSRIAPGLPHPPLVRCYYCEYDKEKDASLLLLEDLSAICRQTRWPIPPSQERCEAAIDSLALIHAAWWGKLEELTPLHDSLPVERTWVGRYMQAMESLTPFLESLGDRISDECRSIYQQALPKIFKSFDLDANYTLIHGDAHSWNFMFPIQTTTTPVWMIDWNMWDFSRGTDDLAYLMGLHWSPERRSRLEEPLLRRYIEQLRGHGISDYSWDKLWDDYRLSCICNLLIPVWQWRHGIHPSIWWFHLERSFLTYQDLECEEVVGL
ncbi:MAG: ecdysteroid 22-kinase family protein [Anaerolineales bacterium]|nr:ecdysteroid 22-kinase family protein [Anaerolineales bacterium]